MKKILAIWPIFQLIFTFVLLKNLIRLCVYDVAFYTEMHYTQHGLFIAIDGGDFTPTFPSRIMGLSRLSHQKD